MTVPVIFDKYFKYVENTEPPLVFHRWSLLASLGALLGRQYSFPFGDFNIFPNQYVMLIGDPGTRKSTAIKLAKKILGATGYANFSFDRTSKEKFLLDLEGVESDDGVVKNPNQVMTNLFGGDFGTDPREVYIVADEFNTFIGPGNMDFLSLLGNLWDWDDESQPFRQRLKNSRSVSIYQPTINILGGNTHAGFAEAFPPQSIGQGFLSRLILVFGESSGKKIAFPIKPSDELRQELCDLLLEMKNSVHGQATMSSKARQMMEVIYRTFNGLEDARFTHYSTRRQTHLIKLCMLMAAANLRTEIQAEDVLFANTLLTYTEHRMPAALGEFGKSKNSDVAARILSVLAKATAPVPEQDLWKQVQSDLEKPEDMQKILAGLLQATKIQYVHRTRESSTQGYLIVRKQLKSQLYVDYNLLPESKL